MAICAKEIPLLVTMVYIKCMWLGHVDGFEVAKNKACGWLLGWYIIKNMQAQPWETCSRLYLREL